MHVARIFALSYCYPLYTKDLKLKFEFFPKIQKLKLIVVLPRPYPAIRQRSLLGGVFRWSVHQSSSRL